MRHDELYDENGPFARLYIHGPAAAIADGLRWISLAAYGAIAASVVAIGLFLAGVGLVVRSVERLVELEDTAG